MLYSESVKVYKDRSAEVRSYKNQFKVVSEKLHLAKANYYTEINCDPYYNPFQPTKENINMEKEIHDLSKEKSRLYKLIKDLGRKNMHHHIALSIFRGTPIKDIMAPNTKVNIRAESVMDFIYEITGWR